MTDKRKLKPSASPRPLPIGLALGLGVLVLLVHLWLLARTPRLLDLDAPPLPAPQASLSFSTRSVEIAPPPPPTPGAAPAAAAAPAQAAAPARSSTPVASLVAGDGDSRRGSAPDSTAQASADPPAAAQAQPAPPAPEAEAAARPSSSPAPAPEAPRTPAPASEPAPVPAPMPAPVPEPVRSAEAPPPPPPPPPAQTTPVEAAIVATGSPAPRLQVPGSVRLVYELSGQARGFPYSAEALMTWQQEAQRYEARLVISSRLLLSTRTMSSVGELDAQGISPRRFSDRSRSEQATHFQPEQGRIVFSNNAPQAAWQPGVQDRLSLFFQLAAMLAGEPSRYAPGTQVQVPTAGGREVDTSVFTVLGPSTQALPMGAQATVALRRERRREHDQAIELWFAPALGYLPVRIRITQANGDVLDQRLASLQPL